MDCRHACGGSCDKNQCGACCGTECRPQLTITPVEYALLLQFAVTPFLPVAASWNLKTPIYLEETAYPPEEYSHALTALSLKGLIRIDYDLPLTNFQYHAYKSYPMHGSMALTAAGQEIVEQLEIQDVQQDDK